MKSDDLVVIRKSDLEKWLKQGSLVSSDIGSYGLPTYNLTEIAERVKIPRREMSSDLVKAKRMGWNSAIDAFMKEMKNA